jgi:hypothetical protein
VGGPRAPAVAALRGPTPLTPLKKTPGVPVGEPRTAPSDPVPGALMDPGSSQPLLLTRRKSGKHKTLPFGMPMLQADATPPPKKK